MWRARESGGRLFKVWMAAVIALGALAACQGGGDTDQGDAPSDDPSVIPVVVGDLELQVNPERLMADGASFATVKATLTDARGIARFGWPVRFNADLGDITWVWSEPTDGGTATTELFPTSCLIRTNSKGEASCILRSGFTRGQTFVNASAEGPAFTLLSTSAEFNLDPQPTEARGVTIAFIGDSCDVPDFLEWPVHHRVEVQITRSSDDPLGPGFPVKNTRVYFNSTRGHWERTLGRFDSDVTDDAGLAFQTLVIDEEDAGKTVTVVAFVNGSLPESCSFIPGLTEDEISLALTVTPDTVQGIPIDQSFGVRATVETPGRVEIDNRPIRFNSPVGQFTQDIVQTSSDGTAGTTLLINAATAGSLMTGESFTLTAIDQRSGVVAFTDLTVGGISDAVEVEVEASPATITSSGLTTVVVSVAITVNGAAGSGREVRLSTGGGTCAGGGSLCTATTDATGVALFAVQYDGADFQEDSTILIQAVDVASLATGSTTIDVSAGDLDIVVEVTPGDLNRTTDLPASCVPFPGTAPAVVAASVLINEQAGDGRTLAFSAVNGTLASSTAVTNTAGVATVGLCYPSYTALGAYAVTVVDVLSGATGEGTVAISE